MPLAFYVTDVFTQNQGLLAYQVLRTEIEVKRMLYLVRFTGQNMQPWTRCRK